jgi:ketosteroid isomerase-like protein
MRALVLWNFILALTLLTLSPAASAQSGDEAAVAQAVEALRKAALAKDRKQFEALLADQASYGHSAGRIETKTQFIDGTTSPRSVWKFIDQTDQTIQIAGNKAIVRHMFTGENESEGKTNAVKIGILMVWQKQDGRWKLLARQAYRI